MLQGLILICKSGSTNKSTKTLIQACVATILSQVSVSLELDLGPVQTMARLWEEKRLDHRKCRNAQSLSSRPSH
jgi:hypothetical protein